jgi:hypothetical protein
MLSYQLGRADSLREVCNGSGPAALFEDLTAPLRSAPKLLSDKRGLSDARRDTMPAMADDAALAAAQDYFLSGESPNRLALLRPLAAR